MRTRWGQNFLVSPAAALRVVESLRLVPEDQVVEIGPGRGILTMHLLQRCASLTVVELDQYLATTLTARWGHEKHLTVVSQDFLTWEPPPREGRPWKVMGNLPYSAAAAILQRVLSWDGWDRAVFMVQKEVADRITATPGTKGWGLLGLSVQSRATARRLFEVRPGSFRPAPQVMSTVIELERLLVPPVSDFEAFFRVAHAAFGQRRKTLLNSLSHGLELDKPLVEKELQRLGIDPVRRPETLSIQEFIRLSEKLGR